MSDDLSLSPRVVDFATVVSREEEPGIVSRALVLDGERWALVRYGPGAERAEPCLDGHRGYVVQGRISYELDKGERLEVRGGSAFWLPPGIAHRGMNSTEETLLFLVDVPYDPTAPSARAD